MYYPYLRARQFELIGLRELSEENKLTPYIIPVLEPVNESLRGIEIANKEFYKNGHNPYIILNPLVGKLKGDSDKIAKFISELSENSFQAAFHFCDNTPYINSIIDEFNLSNCMLIGFESFTDENDFEALASTKEFSHIMLFEPHRYRALDRRIKSLTKNYIRLDNSFEKLSKNADYLPVQPHKFSEENVYYSQDNYQGFSDFTTLPKEFSSNGYTPRAVAIHLTYINSASNDEIWIRHFTSDTNDSISDVQGKFGEAAKKAVGFCEKYPLKNSATDELIKYYTEAHYPGLGVSKKISIKNHLLILQEYLS